MRAVFQFSAGALIGTSAHSTPLLLLWGEKMKVSEIFEEEPIQWGLRGDPFLWRELKEVFKGVDMPDTPQALQVLVENEYEKSTGHPISYQSHFGIERFRSTGMSSGGISPKFWASRAIPLLVSRHPKS